MVPVAAEHRGKVFVIPSGGKGAETAYALMRKVGIPKYRIAQALVPVDGNGPFRIQLDRLSREHRDKLLGELHRSPLVDVGDMPPITSMEVASYFIRLLEARWQAKQDPGQREGKPDEIEKEFRMRLDRAKEGIERRFLEQAFSLCLKMVEENQPEHDRIEARILELENEHEGKKATIVQNYKEKDAAQKAKKSRYTFGGFATLAASLGLAWPNLHSIYEWFLPRMEQIPFVKDAGAVTGAVMAGIFGLVNGVLWFFRWRVDRKIIKLDLQKEKGVGDYETEHHSEVDRRWEEHAKFRDEQAVSLQLAVIEAMMNDYPIFVKDDLAMRGFPGAYDLDLGRGLDREKVIGIYRAFLENSQRQGNR